MQVCNTVNLGSLPVSWGSSAALGRFWRERAAALRKEGIGDAARHAEAHAAHYERLARLDRGEG